MGIVHEPFLIIFLYVQKANDSLDLEQCLELLRGYRLGTNPAWLLDNYWQRHRIVPKVGKYLWTSFGTGREVN